MRRRFEYKDRELEDFIIRFYPAGNYTWTVPPGCTEVDVFLLEPVEDVQIIQY